jgi:hypothetical protein
MAGANDFDRGVIEASRANDGTRTGKERTVMPDFAECGAATDRVVPIVVLERI